MWSSSHSVVLDREEVCITWWVVSSLSLLLRDFQIFNGLSSVHESRVTEWICKWQSTWVLILSPPVTYNVIMGVLVLPRLNFLLFTIKTTILVSLLSQQRRKCRVSWGNIWFVESDITGHLSLSLSLPTCEERLWTWYHTPQMLAVTISTAVVFAWDHGCSMFYIYPCKGLYYYQTNLGL